jgi:ankyrin repeat protein
MSTTPKSLISTLSRISVLSCVALAAATQDGKVAPPKPSQVAPANPATAQPAPPAGIATPAKPGTAAPVDARQAIRFEPEVLNLGEMSAEVAKTGTIKVINVLDTPVTITKIVPGCGCTTTSAPPAPLAPGESANVDITLKPGSKAGIQLTKMVTFQIEGHAPQMLTVKGDVKAYIALSQDMVDGPTSDTAPPTTIKLTSVENVPFRVTSVLPDVLVEVPKESKTEQEVQIDWKKWEATGSSVKISIMTDNPKAPQLGILVKRSLKAGATPPPATTQAETSPASVLAVRGGDMTALKTAIAAPGGVEAQERMSQRTALHFASEAGNMDAVKMLLDAKANPNVQDRTGKTPVTIAAERGRADVLKALLASGGDANARDQVQGSPLLWASGLGTPETVSLLLGAGANPNIQDVNGMTPLMWAAGVGKPETVAMLLQKGADAKAMDKLTGETALMRALRTGKIESVKLIMAANPDLAMKNSLGMTPFLIVCAYGDLDKIKMVIDAGADKTAKDSRGWGAIDHARNRVDAHRDEVIKYLEPLVPASTTTAPPQVKESAPAAK